MMCKCIICEAVIGAIILIALITQGMPWSGSQWVIAIASVILILHSFMWKNCICGHCWGMGMKENMDMKMPAPARKRR
ncbi:hypothetical protein KW805_02100 [Candidatus Pacearchaeota archaeon]|nr:hypothetical protein [Candidatus Pacearchaeota archaeon]